MDPQVLKLSILNPKLSLLRVNSNQWKTCSEHVQIGKKLGSGAFADVYLGTLMGSSGLKRIDKDLSNEARFYDCDVAIKVLPLPADCNAKDDFQKVSCCRVLKTAIF